MLRSFRLKFAHLHPPFFVLDHDRIHDAVDWEALGEGRLPIVRAPHPAHGPDFNRVAEHFVGAVKARLRDMALHFDVPSTAKAWKQRLLQVVESVWPEGAIRWDADGLPELWRVVALTRQEGGFDGGWPDERYR